MIKGFNQHIFISNQHVFIFLNKQTIHEAITISFLGILSATLSAVWGLFLHWLSIFAAPVKQPEMLWIIIPIWVNWFFTEFFQEKHGTSFGNAVSNGVIAMWAGIDWARYVHRLLVEGAIRLSFGVFLKFFVAIVVFTYGIYVIIAGIKTKHIVYLIGRIRWITYILLMFTPVFYGVIRINLETILAIIVFFPLYYWVIEFFDRITPEPRLYKEGS